MGNKLSIVLTQLVAIAGTMRISKCVSPDDFDSLVMLTNSSLKVMRTWSTDRTFVMSSFTMQVEGVEVQVLTSRKADVRDWTKGLES